MSIMTAHELLIVYEYSPYAIIYAYKIEDLIPFMTPAEGDLSPSLESLSPSYTCRVDFEDQGLTPEQTWHSQFTEMDPWTRKLRLLSRSFPSVDQTILTMSSFEWPPAGSDGAHGMVIVPPIPRTVIRFTQILSSSVRSALWAYGSACKTIAWMSRRLMTVDEVDDTEIPVFKFAEVDGDEWEATEQDVLTTSLGAIIPRSVGKEFELEYPAWLADHGELLSMDLDDARGRLALSMSDRTIVILEFV
jgi:hypothetical protein